MFETALGSMKLFLRGRLFKDPAAVLRAWATGLVATLLLLVVLSFLSPWVSGVVGGLAGGALMPWLFRNLKHS